MAETDRTVVKTYVPRYQKDRWEEDAAEIGMSQSEFVRTMVQAGRSDLDLDTVEGDSGYSNPGGNALETRVRSALSEGARDWDALREAVIADLEGTLESLQNSGAVRFAPGEGYVLEDE
jgi:hypothetical protein